MVEIYGGKGTKWNSIQSTSFIRIWACYEETHFKMLMEFITNPSKYMSMMAKWLEQASQWHEKYCHDLEVMSSNHSQVELGVRSSLLLS